MVIPARVRLFEGRSFSSLLVLPILQDREHVGHR